MPTNFDKAESGDEVLDVVAHAIQNFHPELHQVELTVDVLFASNPEKDPIVRDGYPLAYRAKKTGPKERAKGAADVEIVIDAGTWGDLDHAGRLWLIDDALARFKVVRDKKGRPQCDDRGRPKLRTRANNAELGILFDVCRRHKGAALPVRALRQLRDKFADLGIPWPEHEGAVA